MPVHPLIHRLVILTLLSMCASPGLAQTVESNSLKTFIAKSDLIFDSRLRFELVDQDGFDEDAQALTLRSRFGFETASFHGFKALVEGDFTRDLGVNDFNSTVNGKTGFPVVVDPDSERLNRLQLGYHRKWDGASLAATVGRQRIKLDDDRFIGNVGFRQNEQTFDAARLQISPFDGLTVDYSYIWQVNRIFGSNSANKTADADSHLINARYETPWAVITSYAYLLDLEDQLASSASKTFGLRMAGTRNLFDDWQIAYGAEFANQTDFGGNPENFDLNYIMGKAGFTRGGLSFDAQIERLEGNGRRGFTTPLATLHAFQGFADVFLVTPAAGLRDIQTKIQYRWRNVSKLGDVRLSAWFHDFSATQTQDDLGEEIDFGLFITPRKGITFSIKYADFFGADDKPSLRRFWTGVDVKF
ncbi:hypothetical protein JCM17846_02970 [Iodidimonas nitroreducens]|uniref:Alginate export domain-containing protein n=2 Tax=Iodidimonas nitroreducens TaxID=1236968 RepID=A0A5A7N4G3_9PROT|nr:hypothetical protein AQ1_02600 [alpha proteobacterium Q-1]GER02615.1 hypothetical protein JCM17846_02970 [Iodidimonas nitroreducens]